MTASVGHVPNTTPVLVFKTGRYAIHHGALGIVRSLGTLGAPVYAVVESRFAPTALSRYLTGKFVWDTRGLDKVQLLEGLGKIGKKIGRPTVLISTDDFAAILVAEEATILRQWFIFPQIDQSLPRTLVQKKQLYQLCQKLKIPHPNAVFPSSIHDASEILAHATFPIAVKIDSAWLNSSGAPSVRIVSSAKELTAIYHQTPADEISNLLLQEYIADGEDWFFHGYCNAESKCLAAFTGRKLRSYPLYAGSTVLGKAVTNTTLSAQAELFLKAVHFSGIMDIDFRLDSRDGKYKVLDFNPRVGAQFRLFENSEGSDLAHVCYSDLSGQPVRKSSQVDGRIFIVEFDDLRASLQAFRQHELSVPDWWRSFRGIKEFAWFNWADPIPFLLVCMISIIKVVAKVGRKALRRPSDGRSSVHHNHRK